MAGSLAMIPSNVSENPLNTVRDEWQINFARFFAYPLAATTCSDLLPLPPSRRNRSPRGNWIASPSIAFLRLVNDYSNSDVIICICFNGEVLEEHYVSKLHFSWPQVSCASGFPARGIKTVLVSYRDSVGEIQKFGMRFPSFYEAQAFINTLKGILKDKKGPETPNTDFGSEISSQSEFMSSNKHSHRAGEELSTITPFDTYIPTMPPSFNDEEKRYSGTQEKETTAGNSFEGIYPAFPPSFTSLLMDCSQINTAQQTVSKEIDLKSQIVKYMEDSSFQDILSKVEKVISEIGGDMSL
ncbi:protein POOR HOMOLOGOUS SYNAPSIS 1-like [Neltuma alba]|uniref:protein POOR HOMOLOGOUS SYNAPSIS 1-like n=1 Tax=Neltuma alba TaxID=207710 RepID=UPI0010A47ED6|nr:protein POOR HOMOLOGOUS SYNAPSIS 1-like [Prosopis alba]XP_028790425.1 protein POOR HOMOLOGOUS SYNAPSIS 1-like [Prosopis alba]